MVLEDLSGCSLEIPPLGFWVTHALTSPSAIPTVPTPRLITLWPIAQTTRTVTAAIWLSFLSIYRASFPVWVELIFTQPAVYSPVKRMAFVEGNPLSKRLTSATTFAYSAAPLTLRHLVLESLAALLLLAHVWAPWRWNWCVCYHAIDVVKWQYWLNIIKPCRYHILFRRTYVYMYYTESCIASNILYLLGTITLRQYHCYIIYVLQFFSGQNNGCRYQCTSTMVLQEWSESTWVMSHLSLHPQYQQYLSDTISLMGLFLKLKWCYWINFHQCQLIMTWHCSHQWIWGTVLWRGKSINIQAADISYIIGTAFAYLAYNIQFWSHWMRLHL